MREAALLQAGSIIQQTLDVTDYILHVMIDLFSHLWIENTKSNIATEGKHPYLFIGAK